MSTTLDELITHPSTSPTQKLRSTMAAARLSFTWLGARKSLTTEQRTQAADSFGAEGKYLSAGKKLLDTSHHAFKAVTAIKGRAVNYFRGVSLPYPEAGIRLIRQGTIPDFGSQIAIFRDELDEAVIDLDRHYSELRAAARDRLGDLYDSTDYPATLIGAFAIEHDFPSVEPPPYLQQLSPELYHLECQRVQSRFDEAVQMAESAFTEELSRLVSHLTERLAGTEDGKPKVFRDSVVENLTEFFDRFKQLNIGSSEQLEQLVTQAQQVVSGVRPQQLRFNGEVRERVATQLSGVQSVLDGLLIDRPRRNIIRRPR
jgi:hypothetical protein